MASAYYRFPPSTGPGTFSANVAPYGTFQANQITTPPGIGYASNLGPNNTPNPGPPAPQTDNGILLEPSWNEFIALETGSGGPTDHLIMQ